MLLGDDLKAANLFRGLRKTALVSGRHLYMLTDGKDCLSSVSADWKKTFANRLKLAALSQVY